MARPNVQRRRVLAALVCAVLFAALGQGLAWAQSPPTPASAQHGGAGGPHSSDGNLAARGLAIDALRDGGRLAANAAPTERATDATGQASFGLASVDSPLLAAGWAPTRPAHFRLTARTHAP